MQWIKSKVRPCAEASAFSRACLAAELKYACMMMVRRAPTATVLADMALLIHRARIRPRDTLVWRTVPTLRRHAVCPGGELGRSFLVLRHFDACRRERDG